jgi:hypothetical protein
MPNNPLFYPDDFPDSKRGTTSSATNSVESAIALLATTTRDTALKQVHARRNTSIGVIANQGKLVNTSHAAMPLNFVGLQVIGSLLVGKTAYIPGRDGLQCFSYSNEVFRRSSIKLPQEYRYVTVAGNAESGKIGGGASNGNLTANFNKIKYYPQENVEGAIAQLSEPLHSAMGQMGDATRGILASGIPQYSNVPTKKGHLYNRFAPHGGLSSQYAGYILGGSNLAWEGSLIKSIEKIAYGATIVPATTIASTLAHSHVIHAAFSGISKGYLLGGSNSIPPGSKWASRDITGFTFAGEVAAPLSITLPNELTCSFGAGSSEAGYVFTGWVEDSFNTLSNTSVFKIRYTDEQPFLLEIKLLEEAWDTGAVSDYSPGFSYS